MHEELFQRTKNKFWEALKEGYKPNGLPADTELTQALQSNLVTFSLFKNHQNMRDVAAMLTDAAGNPRPYADFEAEALQVSVNYNRNWLQAEYDTAVKSAQSASQWVDIQRSKKDFPLLRYVTANDERVRHEHAGYDGVTLPVDHAFWRTHFPPNGFRCRCRVEKLRVGLETQEPNVETEGSQFNFNPGITGEVFGAGNSYFKHLPQETVTQLREYSASVKPGSKWW
ncbi:hypothetical protein E4631_24095 [Hymenobacter sp. UV11]|uniref:phage head morphogenesis protein n=1 Tax=Hymenobacter sp. UV11 TaxID=1849735 RepID=UPI00105F4EDB|nr:phage minor head protein [Hymenobacter sp. UV11]TDN38599.1 hypothetical protein A8B98_22910 [Hymenobacter sp. UV11]TFZ63013.1 hypothetical protein E4631_24095 [Hymenobacter sp. UV11]